MLTVPVLGRMNVDLAALPGVRQVLRLVGGKTDAGPYREGPPTAVDWSERLAPYRVDGKWNAAAIEAAFARIRPRLEGVRFLLAPCYLADFLHLAKRVRLSDYLEAQLEALRDAGLEAELVPVNSQGSIAENADILGRRIAESAEPVCVISHSKGGIDTLECLLGADEELVSKVVGWLAIQAPFAGAPLADRVVEFGPVRLFSELLLQVFGGSGDSLHDHRSDTRADYMASHDRDIEALAARLPILAVAGALDREGGVRDHLSPTYPSLLWMREQGIRSDGIVPTTASILPHARYVVATPVDHTALVAAAVNALSYADRKLLTKLLLALLMDEQSDQTAARSPQA